MWRLNQCLTCTHYDSGEERCPAFLNKIPIEIWNDSQKHSNILVDQIDKILYKPKTLFSEEISKKGEANELIRKRKQYIERLENYFSNFLLEIKNGNNIFNQAKLRNSNSINIFYKIEPIEEGIKIVTKYYFLYTIKRAGIHGDIVTFYDKTIPLKLRRTAGKLELKELEKKLSELHYLYNTPIWKSNTLLISMDLDQNLEIDFFKNHDVETRVIYKYNIKPETVYTYLGQDEEEITLLKKELERLEKAEEMGESLAKKLIVQIIENEDPKRPLHDLEIKSLIEKTHPAYFVHRKMLAKYRSELGIGNRDRRKKNYTA